MQTTGHIYITQKVPILLQTILSYNRREPPGAKTPARMSLIPLPDEDIPDEDRRVGSAGVKEDVIAESFLARPQRCEILI